jgi:hypothetical protein
MVEIIVPLGAFALTFGIVYIVITSIHRQRMEMIARGMNPKIKKKEDSPLEKGFILLFGCTGIIVGFFFQEEYGMKGPYPYLLFVLLFLGIGYLFIAYFNNKNKKDKDSNLPIEL